jgi:glycerophosphoryl diester phosphodiesterase
MAPRLPSLDGSIRTFAHRGASAHAPENTLEAFDLALKLGASALESDVWLTADGVPVLSHDGRIGPRFRRRPIASLRRSQLPAEICSLDQLYERVGTSWPLSLDVKDVAAFPAIIGAARQAGGDGAEHQLWLCSPLVEALTGWRTRTSARLVSSITLRSLQQRPEQLAAQLRQHGIDALNLPHREWSGGLVTMLHRFDRYAFGWGAEHEREIAQLVDAGIDGVYSDHVDRMAAVAALYYPSP